MVVICLEVPCQYSSNGNSLAVKWRKKERKKVEDALARNQERKTDSMDGAAKE